MNNRNRDLAKTCVSRWYLLLTIPACIALALYFLFFSAGTSESEEAVPSLNPGWYTPKTARGEEVRNAVMVGNCFICHAFWVKVPPDPEVRQPQFAHVAIKLDHGRNDRCYNCHLIYDRNKYAADDGTGIMSQNVELLCARCHGLIYKDWQNGTHGLRRCKWQVKRRFDQENFKCTECHDPHSPKFKFKDFAPAPTWPAKYIRKGQVEDHGDAMSEYIIGSEPKEMF